MLTGSKSKNSDFVGTRIEIESWAPVFHTKPLDKNMRTDMNRTNTSKESCFETHIR
jgi:hypothetical protein